MKSIITIALIIVLNSLTNDAEAQRRKTRVYKGKRGRTTVVHKNRRGRTTVVHRGKRGRLKVVRTPRRRVVHYRYRHLPKFGAVVTRTHTKAVTIRFGGIGYRYHSGIWYRPQGPNWLIVRPSFGVRIRVLPVGYRRIVLGPQVYYYYYGTYYVQRDNEYEVVEAPMGAEVASLPDGYKTITMDGKEYYELDNIYYTTIENSKGEEMLVVVENPNG